MSQFNNILIVVQNNETVDSSIRKAVAISDRNSDQPSRIHAVRIVYEGVADLSSTEIDKSAELKKFILQSEQEAFCQLILEATPANLNIESAVLWNPRLSEGVVHAAETTDADLIIKESEDDGKGYLRTPDDWNILREAKIPVFLIKPSAWGPKPTILAAIDALDETHNELSTRILDQAAKLTRQLSGSLQICSFYPLFEPWSTRLGLLQNYKDLRKEIERNVGAAVSRLIRSIGAPSYQLHCVEGQPEFGIEQLTDEIGADILVIGNCARVGISAAFIGNTAEKILHRTQNDVLTIA